MCGRYENAADDAELKEEFKKHIGELDIDYDIDQVLYTENIAPTNIVKIIQFDKIDNVFKLRTIKWGIKTKIKDPARIAKGKDPFIMKDIFNSRIETISKKGSNYMKYMRENRCIFPMTAFYEWTGEKGKKTAQRIALDKSKIFYAGGIVASGIDDIESASIITSDPNTYMKTIHNRMPVLMTINEAGDFLRGPEDLALSLSVPLDNSIKMNHKAIVLEKNETLPIQNDLFRS
jgi:putative SOS response-associated peptidase YedK